MSSEPEYVIGNATNYLLRLLETTPLIRFSELYDGTKECDNRLKIILGIKDPSISGAVIMDSAACLLEQLGYVTISFTTRLIGGEETDYQFGLTEKGRRYLRSGELGRS